MSYGSQEWGDIESGDIFGITEQIGAITATTPRLSYNGYSLDTDTIVLKQMPDLENLPSRDVVIFDNPRDHGETITGDFWRRKILTFRGRINTSTEAELRDAITEIKQQFWNTTANLDVLWGGKIIRYSEATIENPNAFVIERYPLTRSDFMFRFTSRVPFGEDVGFTIVPSPTTITEASRTDEEVDNIGSAGSPLVAYITWNTATSVTSWKMSSNTTGEAVTLTTTPSAGDIWAIDGITKTITKVNDGSVLDFNGTFIELQPGTNSIDFTTASSAHSFDVTFKYKRRLL